MYWLHSIHPSLHPSDRPFVRPSDQRLKVDWTLLNTRDTFSPNMILPIPFVSACNSNCVFPCTHEQQKHTNTEHNINIYNMKFHQLKSNNKSKMASTFTNLWITCINQQIHTHKTAVTHKSSTSPRVGSETLLTFPDLCVVRLYCHQRVK